jgi:hypothetical protein
MGTVSDLARLFGRELASLHDEVLAYPDDATLWALPAGLPNSTGTLVLHCVGNVRWFIGAQLGASGYVRDREAEFATRDVSRAELVKLITAAADEVTRALASVSDEDLAGTYPLEIGGMRLSTSRWLHHLASHLAYHLGQVDYHRRIVTGNSVSVGTLPLPALADR